jgi:hypothetical protein
MLLASTYLTAEHTATMRAGDVMVYGKTRRRTLSVPSSKSG